MVMATVEWIPSPNHTRGRGTGRIIGIVVHGTAGSFDGALSWLRNPQDNEPDRRVSAHYLIGKTGRIIQLVRLEDTSYHVGASRWQGFQGFALNQRTAGFEFENKVDGKDPYTEAQYQAFVSVATAIIKDNALDVDTQITGHSNVSLKGKQDPGPLWDWKKVRDMLKVEISNTNDDVSDWAKEARDTLVPLGVTTGERPKEPPTREEVWTMLERVMRILKGGNP